MHNYIWEAAKKIFFNGRAIKEVGENVVFIPECYVMLSKTTTPLSTLCSLFNSLYQLCFKLLRSYNFKRKTYK